MTIQDLVPGAIYLLTVDGRDFHGEYVYHDINPAFHDKPFAFRDPREDHGLLAFVSLSQISPVS